MKNEKAKSKWMALAVCIVMLLAISGIVSGVEKIPSPSNTNPIFSTTASHDLEKSSTHPVASPDGSVLLYAAYPGWWTTLIGIFNDAGLSVTYTNTLDTSTLSEYECLIIEDPPNGITTSQISDIVSYVDDGGKLIVMSNFCDAIVNPLLDNYGVNIYSELYVAPGDFTFSDHPLFDGVDYLMTIPNVDTGWDGYLSKVVSPSTSIATKDGKKVISVTSDEKVLAISSNEPLLDGWGVEDTNNQRFAANIAEWIKEPMFCCAEYAVHQAGIPNPDGILNPLRELRDDNLKDVYVDRYYDYSPELTLVIIRDPALTFKAARLLVKYSPMVRHQVHGIGVDKQITRRDVREIVSVTDRLERSVLKNRDEIGAERSQEIIKFLDEFKGQVKASKGKTFSEALQDSIYYKDEQMPDGDH